MKPNPDAEKLVALAAEKKIMISGAESCTGGLISKMITDVPGSSQMFAGCIVAYSNQAKTGIIGVDAETISLTGAVSEDTAGQMAEGANKLFNSTIAYSATGIAGPGGGSAEKPAGTVCFGFSYKTSYTRTVFLPAEETQ